MFVSYRWDFILLRNMFCQFHLVSLFFPLAMSMVSVYGGNRLEPVYWNSSNPLFDGSSHERAIVVKKNDKMDIICPKYDANSPRSIWEYYIIYMVSKEEYDDCIIYNPRNVTKIINCSEPYKGKFFTLLIKPFQPVPGSIDFHPGKSYFFITTSTGTEVGMNNQVNGACKNRKMKITVNITNPSQQPNPRTNPPPVTHHTNRPTTASTQRETPPTRSPSTTRKTTTTTVRTTTTTTRTTPDFKTKRPDYPEKKPDDPSKDTIIDATGPKNMGLINCSTVQQTSILVLLCCIVLTLWTSSVVR